MEQKLEVNRLSENLKIVKNFLNWRTYRELKTLCKVHISESEIYLGKGKLKDRPSISEFFAALSDLENFVFYRNIPADDKDLLNSKGLHSKSIITCMDILFKHEQYECLEELCSLIDEDDADTEARSIRRILLSTRNNLTR